MWSPPLSLRSLRVINVVDVVVLAMAFFVSFVTATATSSKILSVDSVALLPPNKDDNKPALLPAFMYFGLSCMARLVNL